MPSSGGPASQAPFVLVAVSCLAAGCALFAEPFHLSDDAPKSSDFETVVFLPMNFDHLPRPALAQGAERMGDEILDYLEASGYQVVVPRMSSTLALWGECVDHVGGITTGSGEALDQERYDGARSELVRRTLESLPAHGVISATVLVREGRYSGRKLRWDGVGRTVSIDMGDSNLPVAYLNGTDAATSLRTSVFGRRGQKIFERTVGLEPLHRYQVEYPRLKAVERTDLFQNEALIEEVIALSFQPWLVPAPVEEP